MSGAGLSGVDELDTQLQKLGANGPELTYDGSAVALERGANFVEPIAGNVVPFAGALVPFDQRAAAEVATDRGLRLALLPRCDPRAGWSASGCSPPTGTSCTDSTRRRVR